MIDDKNEQKVIEYMSEKHYMKPNTLFVKENGITKEIPLELSNNFHLTRNEDSFFPKHYEPKDEEITSDIRLKSSISGIFYVLKDSKVYSTTMFVDDLKKLSNKNNPNFDEEFKQLIDKVGNAYSKDKRCTLSTYYGFKAGLEQNYGLFTSIIVKTAVIENANDIFDCLKEEDKHNLMLIVNDIGLKTLINHINTLINSRYMSKSENGISDLEAKALKDRINMHHFDEFYNANNIYYTNPNATTSHLCAVCDLPQRCNKIHPEYKENIAVYDEITDGIQTSDSDGLSDQLLVAACNYYIKPKDRPKSLKLKDYTQKKI